MSATIAERIKQAAEAVEADFPGAHVLCVAVKDGVVSLYAKSGVINDKLDVLAALHWVADETAAQTHRDIKRGLLKKPKAGL